MYVPQTGAYVNRDSEKKIAEKIKRNGKIMEIMELMPVK